LAALRRSSSNEFNQSGISGALLRILWVKASKLLPVDTGGKIRTYNILRHLASRHQVTVLSYYDGTPDATYEDALTKEFPGAVPVCTGFPDSGGLRSALAYISRFGHSAPYAITKFTHSKVRKALNPRLSPAQCDLAVCDFLAPTLNFPNRLPVPCVLFQHNVESSLWQRRAATEGHPVRKLFYAVESAKMTAYERRALSKFHHIIAVSEHDRQQMLAMDPSCDISVVPTGVDTRKFPMAPPSSISPPRIVFTGSMDWEPNVDAMEFFCAQIWPKVLSEFPDAVFQIVGRTPSPRVQRLASNSVVVTGSVPSVADYLRDATVVVVPLRVGGGTRLKIYEAMAMGKALISTSIGAEGLTFQSGRDLLLADDASSFAAAISLLLRDSQLRWKLEQAAAQLAAQFDWSVIARKFGDALEKLLDSNLTQDPARPKSGVAIGRKN
jgi:polysaccharide biosynthesis protein PslH